MTNNGDIQILIAALIAILTALVMLLTGGVSLHVILLFQIATLSIAIVNLN